MTQALAVELATAASVTTSGEGTSVDAGELRRALMVNVRVTSFTGVDSDPTPTVSIAIETRPSDSSPWRAAGDAVSVTAAGIYEFAVGSLEQYVRATWTLTNMTSVDFSITGELHVVYADPEDITKYAVPERSIEEITHSERVEALIATTDVANGFVAASFELPLTAWSNDLRIAVAKLAAATLFRRRGMDPQGPDVVVIDAETKAMQWLDRIANGRIKPPGILDSTLETFEGGSYIYTTPKRGW